MKLANLKILSMTNPIGIDTMPYFSYFLTSDKKNVKQVKYSIAVKIGEKIVWQKSEISQKSTFIEYNGELKSKTRYNVEITATNNYGESDTVCDFFETAMLDKSEWQAKWVKSTLPIFDAEKGFGKQPPPTIFKKQFTAYGNIRSARLYATCHGIYIPHLNNCRFSDAEFAPEHTTYGKVLCYQTYDITKHINKGNNDFSMYVGDGWYLGVKTQPRIENYERRHAVLFQIEITYENGYNQIIVSDDQVECAYGKVVCSDLFAGEIYNENLKLTDWQKTEIANYGYDNLIAQIGEPVVCLKEIPVKKIIYSPKGETLLDFGQVLAGRVRAIINEPKNTVITLDHTEVLDKEGNFFQNAEMPDGGTEQRVQYISNGEKSIYEPQFTFHGFRYVKVDGITSVNKDDFTSRVYSSQKDDLGSFYCSNEQLNQLYKNIRNSQTSNTLSIPTDCPQREKAGWTGDIAIYARTALLNEDITAFLNRWLLSVRADQGSNGAVPIVVPYDGGYPMSEMFFGPMYEETETIGSSGWGDACVLVPWSIYNITGNTKIIKDNLDVMEKWCGYIFDRCKLPCKTKKIPPEFDRYLWNEGYHQGDWLVPSLSKIPIFDPIGDRLKQMDFTKQYAAPMYGYNTFALMAKMMLVLEDEKKNAYYQDIADKMKHAIKSVLFDDNGDLPTDLMGAYVLSIAFDLVPEKHKKYTKDKLIKLLEDNKGCLDTGFLSTPYLLDSLCKIGRRDLAYSVLFQTKCPSWLYEVEKGATAIWESWESYEPDGNPKKISFNHYAFGCVDDWIFRNICGITPTSAGFETIRIQPLPDKTLTYAERAYQSIHGIIYVKWQKSDGKFMLNCSIPCNATAEIILPSGKIYQVGSGSYNFVENA